jgi:hypothetical protein
MLFLGSDTKSNEEKLKKYIKKDSTPYRIYGNAWSLELIRDSSTLGVGVVERVAKTGEK